MWVKVCGLRNRSTASRLASLSDGDRPDAVGLNFYSGSRRCVTESSARSIVAEVGELIEVVGLFVDSPLERVVGLRNELGLPTIQLHGTESPEDVAELLSECPGVRVFRAMRVRDPESGESGGLSELGAYFEMCGLLGVELGGCLVDAFAEGQFGGTGQSPPWSLLSREYRRVEWPRLLLAGGLRPDNVGRAIIEVSPWGVDTAGGVEDSVGDMDVERVVQFVRNARAVGGRMGVKSDG